jgi:hypothetical protein
MIKPLRPPEERALCGFREERLFKAGARLVENASGRN